MATRLRSAHPRHQPFAIALAIAALALATLAFPGPAGRASAQEQHGILDGKTFRIELGKKGEREGELDEITFARGLFHSATGAEHGFSDSEYQTKPAGKTVHFHIDSESFDEGSMAWEGVLTGDHIEGKVAWTENHNPTEYWFRGTLRR
jgi:hypothetical protein